MSFMDKLSATLEKFLLPIAQKVGGQRHLVALKDGFIAILTANMAGAIAVMINCVFLQNTSLIGSKLNKLGFWADTIQPFIDKWIINIGWAVQQGTLKIICVLLLVTIAYSLAKSYESDALSAAAISVASYFAILPATLTKDVFTLKDGDYVQGVSDVFSLNFMGANSMFTAIITAFVATEIFVRITKKGWVVKMPETVPPAVSKSFAAIIPGSITLVIFGIIKVLFDNIFSKDVPTWIFDTIQSPLMSLGQSPATYIFLIFIAQFLWFFGLHGMNIAEGVLTPMYKPALLENTDLVSRGLPPKYIITRNFVDVYGSIGGSGATGALVIAIYIFSKKQEAKELAKLATAPAFFQINEPVIFGLPIVLNVVYFIPFILTSPILMGIAYFFTKIGVVNYISQDPGWTCPPIISAFFATNGDFKAVILAAVLLVIAVCIYAPFVIVSNRMGNVEEDYGAGNSANV
ncbi:PTS transporter subunit EIIC [Clostridium sp. SHJSY1]|uniref:PTS sugar transporter subunit IIC n=1 Tax=Clostridium sp. SHJSY1 TaxID=2942483 RepID=UPI002877196D|nr:PTS transporter subunit EIIC [Clostridium sp. SHJSY1]MDS0526174.1 PTS transporter subunit EIIC [Clostridium sp. SHJSY1]